MSLKLVQFSSSAHLVFGHADVASDGGCSVPWHIQAVGGMPADGSLPERLEPVSRIPEQSSAAGDVLIQIGPWIGAELPPAPGYQYAALRLTVEALERVHPALELVLDDLSFQLQTGFVVLQMEILDVTSPIAVGDERDTLLYPYPQGYQQWKFARSTAMGTEAVAIVPTLQADYDTLPKRTQQALDWYIKGLQAPVDADRCIFFWIAFECLETEAVKDIYRAPNCGHAIEKCPECGKSTSKRVSGQSLKQLLGSVGVPPATGQRLWKMRMMVHGAKTFNPDELAALGELLQVLRAAVVALLKGRIGIEPGGPPLVGHGGPAFGAFALGGHRRVDETDLSTTS
jgi:hypothetical protein